VVSPSNNHALVGIKPTVGLISRFGIVPISHSQDTAGPMTRTVADAAVLLTVMSGTDPADPATRDSDAKRQPDYAKFLDAGGLSGARLGVIRQRLMGYSPATDRVMDAAIADLKRLGAIIVDPADVPTIGKFDDSELDVLLYEFKADLNSYLQGLGPKAPIKSLKEAIAFNDAHKDRVLPYFGQEIFHQAEAKGPLTTAEYVKALAGSKKAARELGIDKVMAAHKLDALVAPTGGPASLSDLVNGDYGPGGSSTLPAVAGYPHITVPAGFSFGLPVGISFFGKNFSEMTLIGLAYAYEQATKHRAVPRFLPHVEL
jgi:amidase